MRKEAWRDQTDHKFISQVMCIHINFNILVICWIGDISWGIHHGHLSVKALCFLVHKIVATGSIALVMDIFVSFLD